MSVGREPLPPETFRDLLGRDLPRFGLEPSPDALDRLARFLAELDLWRRRINLTGRLSASELVAHAAESALGGRFLPPGARVIDVGTGGGFPGVPLAIARPDLEMTWLEPREKRAAFLRHLARTVPVENARVMAGRVKQPAEASFECVTSRAVKVDPAVFRRADLLAPGGALILWTTNPRELVSGLAAVGLSLEEKVAIPGSRRRTIAVFRKGGNGTFHGEHAGIDRRDNN
jgi:16S rRNA (guanine527-N7)-methyltransferase